MINNNKNINKIILKGILLTVFLGTILLWNIDFLVKISTIIDYINNNYIIYNQINFLDFSSRGQIGFQYPATSLMFGIINLHHHIFFFIVVIVIFVFVIFYKTYKFSVWNFRLQHYLINSSKNFFNNFNNLFKLIHNIYLNGMSKNLIIQKKLITKLNKSSHLNVTHGTTLEIIWTILPSLVLLFIVGPSFTLLYAIDAVADPDCTVKVIGHQWYWSYEYSDEIEYGPELDKIGNRRVAVLVEHGKQLPPKGQRITSSVCLSSSLFYWWFGVDLSEIYPETYPTAILDWFYDSYMKSVDDLNEGELRLLEVDNPLYLPVGHRVRLHITSDDVLHAFAVPALGVKVDAVPGRLNVAYLNILRKGIFFGQCSELCGVNHGFMPIKVISLDMLEWSEIVVWGSANNDGLVEFKEQVLGKDDSIYNWTLNLWSVFSVPATESIEIQKLFDELAAQVPSKIWPLNVQWLLLMQAWHDHLRPGVFSPGVWV